MHFYDALQLDPAILKSHIQNAETKKEKNWFLRALITRDILLVAFAILFISACSALFGAENSSMAVVIFCILLSARFVNFSYHIGHTLCNLAIVFAILLVSPQLIQVTPPPIGFLINFISLSFIVLATCETPQMGNGGLYLFSYIFLTGSLVSQAVFFQRFLLTISGYILCAGILFLKHRHLHADTSFWHVVSRFHPLEPKSQWQLQLVLGISLLFLCNHVLHLDRFMWTGFACSSLLSAYPMQVKERFRERLIGVICGSVLFAIIYQILPSSFLSLLGPVAGLCLGVCTSYRYKTIFNCFGALLLASSIYGLQGAVSLRIVNNLIGALFGFLFFYAFQRICNHPKLQRSSEA